MKNNKIRNNNGEQRGEPKQLGGITGKGFRPGQSGNLNGRPPTRGLVNALHAKVAEIAPDGHTVEHHLVEVIVMEALRGRHRLAAIEAIFDRLVGKPKQHLDVADVTKELRQKSDAELRFHLAHDRWPDENELLELRSQQTEQEED